MSFFLAADLRWLDTVYHGLPASLYTFRKAQGEVSEFHRFQELSAELVTINEKICGLRPLEQEPGGWTAQEKKRLLRSIRKSRGK